SSNAPQISNRIVNRFLLKGICVARNFSCRRPSDELFGFSRFPDWGALWFNGTVSRILRILICEMNRVLICGMLAGMLSSVCGQQYPFLPVRDSPKSVKTLFQDSRGRLWLGGDQVACFDGARFFHLSDYGMPPANTFDIAEDPDHAIWIATDTGVFRFGDG